MEISVRILHLHSSPTTLIRGIWNLPALCGMMLLHPSNIAVGIRNAHITPAVNRLLTIVASPTDYCGIAAHLLQDAACVLH